MLGLESLKTSLQQFPSTLQRGVVTWIQDYEDAFTDLINLGQKTWNDDDSKTYGLVQNAQSIGMVDTALKD